MGIGELLLLAVGVSMDAFAVSICKGLAMKKATIRGMATVGGWFGGFQALMPLIGFFLGTLFAAAIEAVGRLRSAGHHRLQHAEGSLRAQLR